VEEGGGLGYVEISRAGSRLPNKCRRVSGMVGLGVT
jgi:hypothetical protein